MQPWANRANQALSDKVFGKVVELQVVDTDRYDRTVAKVYRKR
jgi:endonuclease YncB( thermonuclease family)